MTPEAAGQIRGHSDRAGQVETQWGGWGTQLKQASVILTAAEPKRAVLKKKLKQRI